MDADATRWERYESDLNALTRALKARGPVSARQLAEHLKCSKPTIYARLTALRERGVPLKTKRIRDGVSGPMALGYLLES
jgi:biotin operon repressor